MHSFYSKSSCVFVLLTKAGFETEGGERRSELITFLLVWQQILSNAVKFCASKGTRVWGLFLMYATRTCLTSSLQC